MSRGNALLIKTAVDLAGSVVLLVVLSPLLVLIALAIKAEDGGPILFRQERAGLGGEIFRIFKFRTMVVNADAMLDADGRVTGHRITRVGSVLRKLSFDEIPQLFNILALEMSFIGPRPVLPAHVARYTAAQRQRFAMKPGITGLAQVNGRNTLPWSRRLEFDVQYCQQWSLLLDLRILVRTLRVVLLQQGIATDRNPDEVDDLPRHAPEHTND
jgi:lipopolysaccharide/colanic/teichoic acid biosynthesis glycosyltransferase